VAAMAGTHLLAAEVYWKGGTGNLDVSAKKGKLTYR
jgi:hypothetical protein